MGNQVDRLKRIAKQLASYTEHRRSCQIIIRPIDVHCPRCTCGLYDLMRQLDKEDGNEDSADDALCVGG